MSMHFMEHGEVRDLVFDDGRTKQTFKDETDVNRILAKFQVSGVISHKAKFLPSYGDFAEFDFLETQNVLNRGNGIFAALPSEVRREFGESPARFFKFVNDPANIDNLDKLLPAIAKPGMYDLDLSSSTPPGALVDGGEPGAPGTEVPPVEEPPVEEPPV